MPLIWETDFFSGQSPKKEELNIEYTAVGELGEYRGHGEMLSDKGLSVQAWEPEFTPSGLT